MACSHETLEDYEWLMDADPDGRLLFTDNETNLESCFGVPNYSPYVKDSFHRWLCEGETGAVNPQQSGNQDGRPLPAGNSCRRGTRPEDGTCAPGEEVRPVRLANALIRSFALRIDEADYFYAERIPAALSQAQKDVARQAYAGLVWTKQFYHFVVEDWMMGDPYEMPPPESRMFGRNAQWLHIFAKDVLSMPDKWEYPWFAAWDLAFHMVPYARIDPYFAKQQLTVLLREWYMHPNGQLAAYEWEFGDVNPPVHAWAVWRVYKISGTGRVARP